MIIDVNLICFPIIIARRHASASAAKREATSLWISILKLSTSSDTFLATTPETDFTREASKSSKKLDIECWNYF
ncbi:Pre-mRNA-splicing factor spp2 [Gossypium arboreum]|uniref:Pre-mRNA-splicing factor spp2 n=1 Tax=Gossypium arboreum TaxID=29729 RepID=A0A0B0N924_GOSAR|nr:Pre-mRNA-splicing factor spp2 [Gossypium arboreum]